MPEHEALQRLHVRLLKASVKRVDAALDDRTSLNSYGLKAGLDFDGHLYVAPPNQGPPPWLRFVQTGIQEELKELTNRTNAAVLVIRRGGRILAFTFGHGRHLLREDRLEPDFGLKAALNALQHDSLRSLDSFAVEEQTVHRRSQASRAAGIEVFGIDVTRDILRAVTGVPRKDVPLQAVAGAAGGLAVSVHTDFEGLGKTADLLLSLYRGRSYRKYFAWVDNVQRIIDPTVVEDLDSRLLGDLSTHDLNAYLAPPEPVEWVTIHEFAYTRRRTPRDLDLTLSSYLQNLETEELTIDVLKRHRVFAYGYAEDEPVHSWPVYKCLVFETMLGRGRYVLTAGEWFEIDGDFARDVERTLRKLPTAGLHLPAVLRTREGRLEGEPEYNQRVAADNPSMALMDNKLARARGTASGIEVCDLLTQNRELVHVKHRKGGSSSLSHLFAQGRMSAEALLRDEGFREDVRRLLRDMNRSWARRIPADKPDSSRYQVVFTILGARRQHPGDELPFFSQLNLARTYEALLALGYRVGIRGVRVSNELPRGASGVRST